MRNAKVDGEAGLFPFLQFRQGIHNFPDTDGAVIVDTSLLSRFQIRLSAVFDPLTGHVFVAKTDGPERPGRVAGFADFAAGRIGA